MVGYFYRRAEYGLYFGDGALQLVTSRIAMNISNPSAGSIAASVWSQTPRTLTADPATDAGAASLVWNHPPRTLTSDPATDAGAAALVWNYASRLLTQVALQWIDKGNVYPLAASAIADWRAPGGMWPGYVSISETTNDALTKWGLIDLFGVAYPFSNANAMPIVGAPTTSQMALYVQNASAVSHTVHSAGFVLRLQ